MNPRYVSISSLMGLVFVAAMALAAVRAPTVLLTNVSSIVVLALLLTGLAGLLFGKGGDRIYWGGFALFGWVSLLLINGSWIAGQFSSDLTSGLFDLAEKALTEPAVVPTGPMNTAGPVPKTYVSSNLLAERSVKVGNLVQIARLFLVLVLAQLGGLVARVFAARGESAARATEARPAPRNNP
ncbi:hypothetical protein [Singulisphaera sp. PoT]|uniref:hypothetical protein n=1 Tax=Singulisphaera sp. PoT TaxID=3411797 RepID=UPI003BF4DE5A